MCVHFCLSAHFITCKWFDGRFRYMGSKLTSNKWRQLRVCPSWCDRATRGCPHPEGVIIAGSSTPWYSRRIALINLRTGTMVKLPKLPYNAYAIGMTYNHGVLTIAGGKTFRKYYDREEHRSVVFQLDQLSMKGRWRRLPDLDYDVADPVLLNDKRFLYVLGGANDYLCSKLPHRNQTQWRPMARLPVRCDSLLGGGGMVWNNVITLMTSSYHLTFSSKTLKWWAQRYREDNIRECTPVMATNGRIFASVQRTDFADCDIEEYDVETNTWRTVRAGCAVKTGAGRFMMMKL